MQNCLPNARGSAHSFVKRMGVSFAVATIVSAFLLIMNSAAGAGKSPTLPAYPGQPNINAALRQLTKAQEKVDANQADAVIHLQKAAIALEMSSDDKGSFRKTSIRLTNQAIKHLGQKDDTTAKHEIAEAIENVNKAGKAGTK